MENGTCPEEKTNNTDLFPVPHAQRCDILLNHQRLELGTKLTMMTLTDLWVMYDYYTDKGEIIEKWICPDFQTLTVHTGEES